MMNDIMKTHEMAMGDPICNEGGMIKRNDTDYCDREVREPGSCKYGQRCSVRRTALYTLSKPQPRLKIRIRCSDENFYSFKEISEINKFDIITLEF